MNEFLDQVWLDNTVKSYLIVAGIVLFVVLVKKYVAHSIAGFLFQFIKTIWKDIDKKSFTNLVSKPLGSFLAIFVSIVTLYKLTFPHQLEIDIYRLTLKELFYTIASLILIISFIRLLLRIIDFIAIILHIKAGRTPDTANNQLIVFFKDFFFLCVPKEKAN